MAAPWGCPHRQHHPPPLTLHSPLLCPRAPTRGQGRCPLPLVFLVFPGLERCFRIGHQPFPFVKFQSFFSVFCLLSVCKAWGGKSGPPPRSQPPPPVYSSLRARGGVEGPPPLPKRYPGLGKGPDLPRESNGRWKRSITSDNRVAFPFVGLCTDLAGWGARGGGYGTDLGPCSDSQTQPPGRAAVCGGVNGGARRPGELARGRDWAETVSSPHPQAGILGVVRALMDPQGAGPGD